LNGALPAAGLTQATNGTLYGTTWFGGSGACTAHGNGGCGVVFSWSAGLGPFVQSNPSFGKAGSVVGILGNNLTGTTSVTFNGTPAKFTVVSDTLIKATVPSGTATGKIAVSTSSGTLSSNVAFRILP
jgi:hypothetical protein